MSWCRRAMGCIWRPTSTYRTEAGRSRSSWNARPTTRRRRAGRRSPRRTRSRVRALEREDIAAWIARLPQQGWRPGDSPLAAAPEYEEYLFEQWSHGGFDDFWQQAGIYAEGFYGHYAKVPTAHLSGWYDPYARTAV